MKSKHFRISGIEAVNLSDVRICRNKTANFRMNENAETMTISSKNCHHVNLVKLKKNKSDNTITLDIISNCASAKHQTKRHDETRRGIFKFSFQHQLSISDTPHDSVEKNNTIHGIRALSLFWIILLNVVTTISYTASECKGFGKRFILRVKGLFVNFMGVSGAF